MATPTCITPSDNAIHRGICIPIYNSDAPVQSFRVCKHRQLRSCLILLSGLLFLSSASPQPEPTDPEEQFQLGLNYFNGSALPKDNNEAVKWFRKSAEKGHSEAQRFLGCRYQLGEGVPKDDAEALNWFRKAADQGDAKALRLIGMAYANGRGVKEDQTEAVKLYRKSAELGDGAAQMFMGTRYCTGKGCPKDLVTAYMWYDLAAVSGLSSGKAACESLSREMNKEQVAEALRMSNDWQAGKAASHGAK